MTEIPIHEVVWDPKIYPRSKWSTTTIERYVDALEAGDQFPPIAVESWTMRLLDGKHRLEAHKKAGSETIHVEEHIVPDGMTAKHYAATLSARHGDRMSNADLRELAREDFDASPTDRTPAEWGRDFGVSDRNVRRWVSDIIDRERRRRQAAAWRLSKLGWTQREIGERFGVDHKTIANDLGNSGHLADLPQRLPDGWNDRWLVDEAERLGVPLTEAMASAIDGLDDGERLERLDIALQPYDVWNWSGCHDLMGDSHPGRIPGELVCHVLYFFTKPGDLVVDPMAGSGTTLDACLLMGRRARGYDIDERHDRIDIERHDLTEGWPDTVAKASLVFWDPPYYKKMDASSVGHGGLDGYIEDSVSRLDAGDYLDWFHKRFAELRDAVRPGTRLAFVMSDWDSENAKRTEDRVGIFEWDYVDRLHETGWTLRRQIQCPLPTQQIHGDIVNKFKQSRRLARLGRFLLMAEA